MPLDAVEPNEDCKAFIFYYEQSVNAIVCDLFWLHLSLVCKKYNQSIFVFTVSSIFQLCA